MKRTVELHLFFLCNGECEEKRREEGRGEGGEEEERDMTDGMTDRRKGGMETDR